MYNAKPFIRLLSDGEHDHLHSVPAREEPGVPGTAPERVGGSVEQRQRADHRRNHLRGFLFEGCAQGVVPVRSRSCQNRSVFFSVGM